MAHKGEIFSPPGQPLTARQFIRHRNIVFGLPLKHLSIALIPYGYEIDPDKTGWLRPVDKQLHALYLARTMKKQLTYKELAEWVTNQTGRFISWQGLRIIFRYRLPLSTYLLPLHDRIAIATCFTEEKAIEYQPQGVEFHRRKGSEARTKYIKSREEAIKRKEETRRTKTVR